MAEDRLKDMSAEQTLDEVDKLSVTKHRTLKGVWRAIIIIIGIIVVYLGLNTVFNLRFFVGYHLYEFSLYYIVFGLLLAASFLKYPLKPGLAEPWASRLFWVDAGLFFLIFFILL